MPMYDCRCEALGRQSLLDLTLTEHDNRKVKCLASGSATMQQVYSPFCAHASKRS